MSGRLSGDEANAFLRRVQQGELPCLEEFSQPHIPGVAGYQDLLMSANRHGDTALLVAARHGHTAILRQLVETFGVPVQHTNVDGKTALHEAAQNSQVAAVNYLIKAGAKVDSLKIADWLVITNWSTVDVRTPVGNSGPPTLFDRADMRLLCMLAVGPCYRGLCPRLGLL